MYLPERVGDGVARGGDRRGDVLGGWRVGEREPLRARVDNFSDGVLVRERVPSAGDWREHGRRDDAARLLRRLRGRRDDEVGTLLRGDDDSRRVSRRARHDRGSRE